MTTVAGAVLLLLAWWGASNTADDTRQIVWIDVGVVGLIVAGAGIASWLLAGRRAVGRRRARVLPHVFAAEAPAERGADRLVSAPHLTRYHRPACPMVAGKRARAATVARHRAAGLRPCGVCRPHS